jgi:hypothetical protein
MNSLAYVKIMAILFGFLPLIAGIWRTIRDLRFYRKQKLLRNDDER